MADAMVQQKVQQQLQVSTLQSTCSCAFAVPSTPALPRSHAPPEFRMRACMAIALNEITSDFEPHDNLRAPSCIPSHTNPLVLPPSTFRPTRTHWCSLLPHSVPHEPTGAPSFHIPSHTNPLVLPPSTFHPTRTHWCSLLPRIPSHTSSLVLPPSSHSITHELTGAPSFLAFGNGHRYGASSAGVVAAVAAARTSPRLRCVIPFKIFN
jgi:hypothetical protein